MSKMDKKLAAIMFTDIVGYTQQMSEDEDKAFALIKKKRDLLLPLIEKHEGKLIKEIGDGTLTRYLKADNAIDCASRFQSKTDDDLNVRVGIHTGEVIIDNEDVFGDVVNVASRLESIAVPGSVLVSKETVDKLEMSKDFELVSLGMQSLKGVGRLIEVYAIKEDSLVVPKSSDFKDTKVDIHDSDEVPAIAIIPFENKGADEDVFYAYGISADLISDCSSAGIIRVISLKDVEKIQFKNMSNAELSQNLQARYILQGTLWKMGNVFQLSLELYDDEKNSLVWSDRWQEEWDNLSLIKSKISDGLLKLLNLGKQSKIDQDTDYPLAYEFYLKALSTYEKRKSPEDIETAKKLLSKAIKIDNNFLVAESFVGWIYLANGDYQNAFKIFNSLKEKAKQSGNDKVLIACLNNIGEIYIVRDSNIEEAKKSSYAAAELSKKNNDLKNLAKSYENLSACFGYEKNFEESNKVLRLALEIAEKIKDFRRIWSCKSNIAGNHLALGNINRSEKLYIETLNISEQLGMSDFKASSLSSIASVKNAKVDFQSTIKYRKQAFSLYKEIGEERFIIQTAFSLGHDYFSVGDYSESIKYFDMAKLFYEKNGVKHMMARVYNRLGAAYFELENYQEAEQFMKKDLSLHKDINFEFGRILGNAHLLACKSKIGKKIDTSEIKEDLKKFKPEDLPYRDSFILYNILNDERYIIAAYEQIIEAVSDIDDFLKKEFLNYHYPKMIIKMHNTLN